MKKKSDKFKGLETDPSGKSIKLQFAPSDLKKLDEISSDNSQISLHSNSFRERPASKIADSNNRRFIATNLLLLTNGIVGLFINTHLANSQSHGLYSILAFLLVLPYSFFVFEWQRLYSITLSRALHPFINVTSVLATYKDYDPLYQNLYADHKDRIRSCCDGPEINPELPRTAEDVSDEAGSPRSRASTKANGATKKDQ